MTKQEEAKEAIEQSAAKEANREIEAEGGEAGSVTSAKIVIGHIIADAEAATARDEGTIQKEVVELVNNDKMDAKSVIKKVKAESKAEKTEIKATMKSQKSELKKGASSSVDKDYVNDVKAAIKEEQIALKAIPTEVKVAKQAVKSLLEDGTIVLTQPEQNEEIVVIQKTASVSTQSVETEVKAGSADHHSYSADNAAAKQGTVLIPPTTPSIPPVSESVIAEKSPTLPSVSQPQQPQQSTAPKQSSTTSSQSTPQQTSTQQTSPQQALKMGSADHHSFSATKTTSR